jgi:hypothetical protein
MFHSALLRFTESRRGISLLLGFAVVLLVWVSVTVAQAADTTRLLTNLERDLGALRVHLEQLEPWSAEGARASVASNADLGDGSPVFRRLSMATIIRAANRRVERLIDSYYQLDQPQLARAAQPLRLTMYQLQHQIDDFGRRPASSGAAEVRDQVEALLDESERLLGRLINAADDAAVVADRGAGAPENAPVRGGRAP